MRDFIKIKKNEDGVWLEFIGVNVSINLDSIIKDRGPIVQKNLKEWAEKIPFGDVPIFNEEGFSNEESKESDGL